MDKHDHMCLSITPMYSREGNALASSHIMVGLLLLLLSAALTAAAPKPFSGSGSAYEDDFSGDYFGSGFDYYGSGSD